MIGTYRINGAGLYVHDEGRGAAVVYVHGGFATLGRWLQSTMARPADAPWRAALTARFRLVSYDRRGCAHSSVPAGGYDLVRQADDLIGVVDALGLERVHLFASSAGAPIAILAAAGHAARIQSLVIQGSARRILRPGDGVREPAHAAYRILEAAGAAAAFDRRAPGTELWFESPWARRQAQADGRLGAYLRDEAAILARAATLPRWVRAPRDAAEVRNIHAYDGIDVAPHALNVRVPTLVLHGSNDQIFPPDEGHHLARAFPHGRFRVIGGAGHTPVFTHEPAQRQIVDFLACRNHLPSVTRGAGAPPTRRTS
jgi:3-oxoadipate enol-lactonase